MVAGKTFSWRVNGVHFSCHWFVILYKQCPWSHMTVSKAFQLRMGGFWRHLCLCHHYFNHYFVAWPCFWVENLHIPQIFCDIFFFNPSSNFSFVKQPTHCCSVQPLSAHASLFSVISPWFLISIHLLSAFPFLYSILFLYLPESQE